MKFVCFLPAAVVLGLGLFTNAQAQNAPKDRGLRYSSPGLSSSRSGFLKNGMQPPDSSRPRVTFVPAGQAVRFSGASGMSSSPGAWGVRSTAGGSFAPTLSGQLVQGQTFSSGPGYVSPQVAQGAAPPAAGYAPATSGAPAPAYNGATSPSAPAGISSIYAYSGRYNGPYYGYGPAYYGYAGCSGWGSAYNSPYYNSGCYAANACCRAPRRLCTPFGGMTYGCGRGCYVVTPPACPTTCNTFDATTAPPAQGAPQAGPQPQPMPPQPSPPAEAAPPQPVEKRVTPEPQASTLPRISNLPET